MKEIKKSTSFKSKQKGKDVKFTIDLNYSPEYDSFIIKVKEGEGLMAYSSNIERMPLEVIKKLNNMIEEVVVQADSKYHTKKFDYDYADIGQFSLPDSERNKTEQEYINLGKKITKTKFDGDLEKAYDSVVRNKREFGGDFQSGVYAMGGSVKDRKLKVGDKVYRYYTIYDPYKEVIDKSKIYTIVSIEEQKPTFENGYARFIIKTNDGIIHSDNTVIKVDYVESNNYADGGEFMTDTKYAMGGSLKAHGIEVGDTFVKTISGNIQKVKDKNGKIVYVDLSTGERDSQPPLPFERGGGVGNYYIVTFGFNGDEGYQVVNSKPIFAKNENEAELMLKDQFESYEGQSCDIISTKKQLENGGGVGMEEDIDLSDDNRLRVRKPAMPNKKLTNQELAEKHNSSAYEFMTDDKKAFGGSLFSSVKMIPKARKYPNLQDKDVVLKNGKLVKVFSQSENKLTVMEFGKIGSGERPITVDISEVETIYKNGGALENQFGKIKMATGGGVASNDYDVIVKLPNGLTTKKDFEGFSKKEVIEWCEIRGWKYNSRAEKEGGYILKDYEFFVKRPRLVSVSLPNSKRKMANGGGVGLIGNQKRIDMNKNGKIDADDFKLLRSSMNGAWRNDHKHLNHNEDYEVRYARPRPNRKGYKGIRRFGEGGDLFENYDKQPKELAEIVDFYMNKFNDGDYDYKDSKNFLNEVEAIGYTFDYGLDNEPYNLRPIRKMATGGGISKFEKLSYNVAKNYEGKSVKPKYQKQYGKRYSTAEAREVGNRVAGKIKASQKMATGGEVKSSDLKVESGMGAGKKTWEVSYPKIEDKGVYFQDQYTKEEAKEHWLKNVASKYKFATGGEVNKIYVVQYEINGNKKTSEYLLYENDRVEKMLPSNAKIISIKEKMASGTAVKKSGNGSIMVLAKKIRKDGESWQDALKRAGQQLK
jgi:hypothetical protein